MKSGTLSLNHITDADLIMILQQKEQDPALSFAPNQLQLVQIQTGPNKPQVTVYNNCALSWQNEVALKTVYTILHKLIHGHDKEPAQP